jgi:hypothetical protein
VLRVRCRCGVYHGHSKPALTDALPGFDPTGTRALRERFVRSMNGRWRTLRRLVVEAVAVHDIAGTGKASVSSVNAGMAARTPYPFFGLDKVRTFQTWLDEALKQVVLEGDGAWVKPYIHEAYAQGYQRASELVKQDLAPSAERMETLSSLTVVELQGVMEAVSQQAVRALSAGLLAHSRPMRIARSIARAVRSVGMVRGRATADTMVVRAHAEATLDAFQLAGVRRVGVLPERVAALHAPRPRPASDGVVIDLDDARKKRAKVRGKAKSKAKAKPLPKVAPDEVFGERVDVVTAGDNDVCPVCVDIADNGPYTIKQARGLIPAHPWCRCAFIPTEDQRFSHEQLDEQTSMSQLHGSFTESLHPRKPKGTAGGGEFTSKEGGDGGKPEDDPTKMGLIALYKRTIMLRKKYKEAGSYSERVALKAKLVQTLELQRDGYAAKGNLNGVERVKAQLTKLGVSQTPSAPHSFYKSNPLPTPQEVAAEQKANLLKTPTFGKKLAEGTVSPTTGGGQFKAVTAEGLTTYHATEAEAVAHLKEAKLYSGDPTPTGGTTSKPASALGQYTPEETAVYNNLSHIVGSPTGIMKFAKSKMKGDLSLTDTSAIAAYSGSGYKQINKSLRAGAMHEHEWGYVNNLNSALEKLPKHVGTVFRKADVPADVLALYKPGMIIEERGFTSTSKSSSVWSGSSRYEIVSKTGRDISHLSTHPSENEVLFRSGTRFRVKNVVEKSGTYHEGGKHKVIHMEEI